MILHEPNEKTFSGLDDHSIDAVITDIPYTVSEIAESCKMLGGFHNRSAFQLYFGEWDTGFNPLPFIENSWRVLKPGGWLITCNGDRLLGAFRDFCSMDLSTIPYYAEFMHRYGIIDLSEKIRKGIEYADLLPKMFAYKATVTWKKTNPVTSVRKTTTVSSCEWIQVARRNNDDGTPAKPIAWNWLGQNMMHNFLQGSLTPPSERLYWHKVVEQIVPCLRRQDCKFCKQGLERKRHGTQKPQYLWRWIYSRYTKRGMKVFDPYAGTGSSGVAAKKFGLDWFGSELDDEYARVAQMNLDGVWKSPVIPFGMTAIEMF